MVIIDLHHGVSRNEVKGSIPMNIDSFGVTQSILLLGSPQLWNVIKG